MHHKSSSDEYLHQSSCGITWKPGAAATVAFVAAPPPAGNVGSPRNRHVIYGARAIPTAIPSPTSGPSQRGCPRQQRKPGVRAGPTVAQRPALNAQLKPLTSGEVEKDSLRVLQLNVNGTNGAGKKRELENLIENLNPDLVFFRKLT